MAMWKLQHLRDHFSNCEPWKRFDDTKSWWQLSKDYCDLITRFSYPLDGAMFSFLGSFRTWFINQIFPWQRVFAAEWKRSKTFDGYWVFYNLTITFPFSFFFHFSFWSIAELKVTSLFFAAQLLLFASFIFLCIIQPRDMQLIIFTAVKQSEEFLIVTIPVNRATFFNSTL